MKKPDLFQIQGPTAFSKSLIWQLNRDYYQTEGIEAWSKNEVPHHLTSNSFIGRTYADLILAFLQDLGRKGQITETVYIVELGSGHGRLVYHILIHLERLIEMNEQVVPPYCMVLSDVAEANLTFFEDHPQLQSFYERGLADLAYFDAVESQKLELRYSKRTIRPATLTQPLVAIANYFFDSLPADLIEFSNGKMSNCSISLESEKPPEDLSIKETIDNLILNFHKDEIKEQFYSSEMYNQVLKEYSQNLKSSHVLFPYVSLNCIDNLKRLSTQGLMLLTIDKGKRELQELVDVPPPELISHGSFSFWTNYHAIESCCKMNGGRSMFSQYAAFYLNMGCLQFMNESESFTKTKMAFERSVNDFGPDDFNGIKRQTIKNIFHLELAEIIAVLRLSFYDSTLFVKILPRLKQLLIDVSMEDRKRFAETLERTWSMYFDINEDLDLAYEIGGILYDLGYFQKALVFFEYAISSRGNKADIYYNKGLCYYQLRQDGNFIKNLQETKSNFPEHEVYKRLSSFDLDAS